MLTVFKERPQIVLEAQKAQFKPHFIIQIFIFIGVYLATQVAMIIPLFFYAVAVIVKESFAGTVDLNNPDSITGFANGIMANLILPTLFLTLITTILVIVYCKAIEKRSLYSMGFVKKKAATDYLIGLAIGLIMFAVAVLIAFLSGTLNYKGFVLGDGLYILLIYLAGFIIQGMSEEVFLRGYFMISVANKGPMILAVLTNSLLFALLHIFNNGIDVLSLINLTLFGIFASIYTLKMNSIWGICAIHTAWNFVQGNVFGIKVSGMSTQVSLFLFESKDVGTIINGGAFGLEGGLAVTIVLVISTIILLSLNGRGLKKETAEIEQI